MARSLQIVGNHSYGGGGYLLFRWCQHLVARGWQVEVLATDPYAVDQFSSISGVKVLQHIYIPREISPLTNLKALRQLLVLLREQDYDVVHTYNATSGVLGRISARLAGVPVILHHQAAWTVTDKSPVSERLLYTPIEYLATLASSRGICVSHAIAQQAHHLRIAPSYKLVTICNGIDPQPLVKAVQDSAKRNLRQELGIPDNHLLIGNTGRLAPQKNNQTLIRAVALLQPLLPDRYFTLVLAGDGPDRQMLEELAAMFDLDGKVRFLGFYEDIPAFLAALDIFVSPSLWEGMSISILEAMAAARPIVTTSISQNAELIEHEVTGLLVPPGEPELLAEAIARFVREPELAQGCASAAQQRLLSQYTIDRMFKDTWDLYIDLLRQNQPKAVGELL